MGWKWIKVFGSNAAPIHDKLYQKLLNIRKVQKRDFDTMFIIVGEERTGKSTLGITCSWILSKGKFTVGNIAISGLDAIEKLGRLPKESILLIDEGSLVFSSKDAMKREQRRIIKILNVCGQKKMILIIILPDFFDLINYIAVKRSRFLIRTYVDKKLKRGKFAYWGTIKKKKLYEFGKKHYNSYRYPRADFVGTFKDFNPLGQKYLDLKKKTLMEALKDEKIIPKREYNEKITLQRDVLINHILKQKLMDRKTIFQLLKVYNVETNISNLSHIRQKIRKIDENAKRII